MKYYVIQDKLYSEAAAIDLGLRRIGPAYNRQQAGDLMSRYVFVDYDDDADDIVEVDMRGGQGEELI